jgi:AraC family transcriptional regulator
MSKISQVLCPPPCYIGVYLFCMHKPDLLLYRHLYTSDLYSINEFSYECGAHYCFDPGFTKELCISFTRKGYLTFNSFRQSHEECNTRVLIEKPGCEFTLQHRGPGAGCGTSFRFTQEAYDLLKERPGLKHSLFFRNPSIFSMLVAATPEAEYLYYAILNCLVKRNCCKLEVDSLVMEMLDIIMNMLVDSPDSVALPEKPNRVHLATVEKAKEYILENFTKNISLQELATHCFISPFHFSRLFKQLSTYSPYQYLQLIRLKHAETLLRSTDLPITDVCFRSGFNRLDYFSAAFTKKFHIAPSKYKRQLC